jgi:hypothetical protein
LCLLNIFSIQYVRHLHDRMNVLENRTAPPKEEENANDAAAAAMNYGMMMDTGTLMITNAPAGYGMNFFLLPIFFYFPEIHFEYFTLKLGGYGAAGYGGASSGIPDPYAQPQQGYGYGGMPGAGYGGAGYY